MSLTHTSDDSLARILHYLAGEDVIRLMVVGSKLLTARLWLNVTELFWVFNRPTFFPSSSFDFAKLRTLSIKSSHIGGECRHLSLHNRSLLPLKPMVSLEVLELDFAESSLIFGPHPARGSFSMAATFPHLTSLTIRSRETTHLPQGWLESLPPKLLVLIVDFHHCRTTERLHPSAIDLIPSGIQHLELLMPIAEGAWNLARFTDLRIVRFDQLLSWNLLDSLPDTLEEVKLRSPFTNPPLRKPVFPHSKFPPKIRVWGATGSGITYFPDCMAPLTLEELHGLPQLDEETLRWFHKQNLRVVSTSNIQLTSPLKDLLPNVESILGILNNSSDSLTEEMMPKTLKYLPLNWLRQQTSEPLKALPLALKSFEGAILFDEDVLALPRGLELLHISDSHQTRFPASVWANLPPSLTSLFLPLQIIDSSECILALPKTLKHLFLRCNDVLPDSVMADGITFSESMKETLEHISITSSARAGAETSLVDQGLVRSLIPRVSEFSRLSSIRIRVKIIINSETLANLPKSLAELSLACWDLENFGLPVGQNVEIEPDWKEAAFARLPEGLRRLEVMFSPQAQGIRFRVFSQLPKHLMELTLHTPKFPDNIKSFFAMLPRRLELIRWETSAYPRRLNHPQFGGGPPAELVGIARRWKEALAEYYSDPFWGAHYKLSGQK